MSSFVHCMVCFAFPAADLKFYLSTCGHVACLKCVQKGAMTLRCKVCQKNNPQVLEINRNLKPELRQLFAPLEDFSTIVREVTRVADFQNGHRMRVMRHLQSKSSNFEALKKYCREEMRKKDQYKANFDRVSVEYKKKCKEVMTLKNQIVKMSSCTTNLNDLTSDPFRTPVAGKAHGQRSFTTSTPYKYPRQRVEDITESTIMTNNQSDTVPSFGSGGIPLLSMDSGGEISNLARMTSAMCRNGSSTASDTLQNDKHIAEKYSRPVFSSTEMVFPPEKSNVHGNVRGQDVDATALNDNSSAKTPATKKSKLDIMSKTQPLPMKSASPF